MTLQRLQALHSGSGKPQSYVDVPPCSLIRLDGTRIDLSRAGVVPDASLVARPSLVSSVLAAGPGVSFSREAAPPAAPPPGRLALCKSGWQLQS